MYIKVILKIKYVRNKHRITNIKILDFFVFLFLFTPYEIEAPRDNPRRTMYKTYIKLLFLSIIKVFDNKNPQINETKTPKIIEDNGGNHSLNKLLQDVLCLIACSGIIHLSNYYL